MALLTAKIHDQPIIVARVDDADAEDDADRFGPRSNTLLEWPSSPLKFTAERSSSPRVADSDVPRAEQYCMERENEPAGR